MLTRIACGVVALSCFSSAAQSCSNGYSSLLIMGDSISAGYMANPGAVGTRHVPNASYPKQLELHRSPVINTAVGGANSASILHDQLPRSGVTASYSGYGAVVIMAGINDANELVPVETTVANIVQLVKAHKITPFCRPQVLVVAPPWFYASTFFSSRSAELQAMLGSRLSAAVQDLSSQGYSVGYLDLYTRSRQLAASYYCSGLDGHPCEAGHLDMAQQIAQKLQWSF